MSTKTEDRALPAAKWVSFLERAGVLRDPQGKVAGTQAKAIAAGKFLGAKVGRTVPVSYKGRTGKATLRVVAGRAREKRYWFEVVWDPEENSLRADVTATVPETHPPTEPARDGGDPVPTPEPSEAPKVTSAVVKEGNGEAWE